MKTKRQQQRPQRGKPRGKKLTIGRLPKRKRGRRLIGFGLRLGAATILGLVVLFIYVGATVPIPAPGALDRGQMSVRILDRDGHLVAERGQSRRYLPLAKMPASLVDAVLATEDRRFYSHFGVDFFGLGRAVLANLHAGHVVAGGSTITQQLAKNLYLAPDRTMTRKAVEVMLAFWLEFRLTKNEILELYLNRAYFGSGAYGVDAASLRYFGKSAEDMSLGESALLAGLLKAPSTYSPDNDPVLAHMRSGEVLSRMVDAGYITQGEADKALHQDLKLAEPALRISAGHVSDWIYEQVRERLSVTSGAFVVTTTLDSGIQASAENVVAQALAKDGKSLNVREAALVVMTPDGAVRAMVGGRSYASSQFNRAVQAKRQPGSAFKPFVYLAAFENGYHPDSQVSDDPVTVKGWRPKNYKSEYRGDVSLMDAFARSVNTVAVKLADDVGIAAVIEAARRLGIRSTLRPEPSLALGTSELSLIELTNAYAPFANGGVRSEAHVISKIADEKGRVLFSDVTTPGDTVIQPDVLGQMNEILGAAVSDGTGKGARLDGHPAGGKTGTTSDSRDAWFIGFTRDLVAGVWVGNDDGQPMRKVVGGSLPARIWRNIMAPAHAGLPAGPLPGAATTIADLVGSGGNVATP